MVKHFRLISALVAALAFATPETAAGQTEPGYKPGNPVGDQNPQPFKLRCWNPTTSTWGTCSLGGGGGGGGGDASAANQGAQLEQETLTNTRLGDIASPANGTVNYRLNQIVTTLAAPTLASGAASSALQTTLNGYVDGLEGSIGAIGDSAWAGSGNGSAIAISKGNYGLLSSMLSNQATAANQVTLNGYVDGLEALLGSANSLLTDIKTAANDTTPVAVTKSGTWTLDGISGTISLPSGAATSANQTALADLFPTSLGTKANATSLATVNPKSGTATTTSVSAATSSTLVLAANSARIGCSIVSDSSANARLSLGSAASSTNYTVEMLGASSLPHALFTCPSDYTGAIYMIWDSATGNARVNERTP
jgi:hypothetical protein